MVLLVLAGIWIAVGVCFLRSRVEVRPADSIGDFRRHLRVLQRTDPSRGLAFNAVSGGRYAEAPEPVALRAVPPRSGAPSAVPATNAARRARTIRRRRDVLFTLLMAMGTTFVLAMVVSTSALWMLHALTDALFLGFLAVLVRMRNVAAEQEMKLRILPQPAGRPQPAPVLVMRRSATN